MLLTADKFGQKASEKFLFYQPRISMLRCLWLAVYSRRDTLAKITDVYHGRSWLHQSLGMKNPCESTLLMNLVEVISPEHLASLVKDFGHRKASLKDIRLLALCLLGYAGFFRHSEICNIRRSDIIFYGTYIKVFIQKSKIDSYREGKWVLIARTGKLTCPVSMLKRCLAKANIRPDEGNFIFRFVELLQILSSI